MKSAPTSQGGKQKMKQWITRALAVAGLVGSGLVACNPNQVPPPDRAAVHDKPTIPVLIPMPVDQAGHRIQTEFWIFPKDDGYDGFYAGLRVPFAPGDDAGRIPLIDSHPVKVRLALHRIDEGRFEPVIFGISVDISGPYDPGEFVSRKLMDGVAVSRRAYSSHSGKPRGTPDASFYQLILAGASKLSPGQYRLEATVLDDQPALQGLPVFLTFLETEWSK
ncbi:MAG: hypothetical protein R3E94_10990 [Burkholderiaceae bacterium]